MASLIGTHNRSNGIKQIPSRAVLSMNGAGIGGDETHPDTIIVLRDTRVFPGDGGETAPDFNTYDGSDWPAYGRYWYQERTEGGGNFKTAWALNPSAHYKQIQNERGGGGTDEFAMQRTVDIERAICWAANEDGHKCAILNLAGGSPDFESWKRVYVPFIIEAWEHGQNPYCRHVYGETDKDENGNEIPGTGDLVLSDGTPKPGQPQRIIQELEYLQSIGYMGGMVLTECGLDGGYGVADYNRFSFQVTAWEAALRPYADMLIGFCVWEMGASEFNADYTNHMKQLVPYLEGSYLDRWQPPIIAPPEETMKDIEVTITTELPGQPVQIRGWDKATGRKVKYVQRRWMHHDGEKVTYTGWETIALPVGITDLRGIEIMPVHDFTITKTVTVDCEEEPENPNPPEPEPLPYLDVEPLSQRDPVWANTILGQNTGHGKTIGNWGCLLVAYNIMARYWGLSERLPTAENAHMVSMGAFSAQYIQPAALRTAYPSQVAYDGYLGRESSAMRPKIKEWIDNGWPVPCRVDFDPTDSDFDQHWVLVVGYIGDTDFYMADPWHGDIAIVNNRYPIAGSDILEAIYYTPTDSTPPTPPPPTAQKIDMLKYMRGDGRIFELQNEADGSQERNQAQDDPNDSAAWFIAKGENGGLWERWVLATFDGVEWICLDTDTSPANASDGTERYYQIRKNGTYSPMIKRYMAIGETVTDGGHIVQFYRKDNCQPHPENSGNATNTTTAKALYPSMEFANGIVLEDVLEIGGDTEGHFFCPGYGRVRWVSQWGAFRISEEHAPGQRPDVPHTVVCGM